MKNKKNGNAAVMAGCGKVGSPRRGDRHSQPLADGSASRSYRASMKNKKPALSPGPPHIIFNSVSAISLGVAAMPMPASLNAAIFAAAVPLPPLTIAPGVAHAASGRRGRAGDESGDRFLAILLDPLGGFLLRAAADFADHDDAVRFRVVVEQFDHVQMRSAVDRIAADADAGGLADAARGQLPDRFVGQRAAARDDADVALFVNVAGRDADAAAAVRILAFAGRDDAGTIRPDEPRLGVALQRAFHSHHVAHRNAFGDGDDQFEAGVRAFENRVGGEGRGNEDGASGRAGLFHGLQHGVEDRHLPAGVIEESGRPCRE